MKKQSQGFTLIELLVAIGIMVALTAVLLPNIRLGDKRLALERASQRLAQDIARTSELALRVQEFSCTGGGVVSGYGAYFDINSPTEYIIFIDCNNNQAYDVSQDGIFETIELESGIQISALSISPAFSIVSVPPDPEIFFNPGSSIEAQVTLQEPSGNAIKVIKMNNRGLIDID